MMKECLRPDPPLFLEKPDLEKSESQFVLLAASIPVTFNAIIV
jgi:hypothetical protein